MKIVDYCKKMKKIADQTYAGGFFVSEKELVMCISMGLGSEYEIIYVKYTVDCHYEAYMRKRIIFYIMKPQLNKIIL